jgi:hypothetical protein
MSETPVEEKWYKITWISNAFKVEETGASFSVGVCEFSKKVAFLTDSDDLVMQLTVHDLYIIEGKCEEGCRCLCKSCPYNTTTATSLARSSKKWRKIKAKEFQRLCDHMQRVTSLLKKEIDGVNWLAKQLVAHFEEPPIVIGSNKGKRAGG